MNEETQFKIDEIHDRCRRMETQLHKIREGLNIEMPMATKQVTVIDADTVQVQGFDVTITQIKRALQKEDIYESGHWIDVLLGECCIAEIKIYD